MVQGSTNAVIQQGGGGGNVVYAVNQTGKELVAGDKVWLNMTTTENVHSQNFYRYYENQVYNVGNKMFSNGMYRFDWDGEKFVTTQIGSSGFAYSQGSASSRREIQHRDGIAFTTLGGNIIRDDGTIQSLSTDVNSTYILNKEYCMFLHDGSFYVRRYDYQTGKVEDTDIAFLAKDTWKYYSYYCPDGSKQFAFYRKNANPTDIYIKENIDEGNASADVAVYTINETDFYPVFFTDGFNIGSYCIAANHGGTYGATAVTKPIIYKFYEDGFRLADDLPESLSKLMYVNNVWTIYNNETRVLTVSKTVGKEIHVYKLGEDGLFHEIEFDIDLPTNVKEAEKLSFVTLSDDMSQLFYSYVTGSYDFPCIQTYKFNYVDGKFRATTSVECTENTLTGFATGNVNEAGESEINTVLPPKVTLTFNVTPDPDTLEIKGVIL